MEDGWSWNEVRAVHFSLQSVSLFLANRFLGRTATVSLKVDRVTWCCDCLMMEAGNDNRLDCIRSPLCNFRLFYFWVLDNVDAQIRSGLHSRTKNWGQTLQYTHTHTSSQFGLVTYVSDKLVAYACLCLYYWSHMNNTLLIMLEQQRLLHNLLIGHQKSRLSE